MTTAADRPADPPLGRAAAPTLLAFLLLSVGAFVPNTLGALAVLMQADLDFDDAQLGLLLTAFWACTSVLGGLVGSVTDRTGWRVAAVVGCVLTTAALVTTASAPGYAVLVVAMVVAAAGFTFSSPTSNLVVVQLVALRRQSFAFGLKQTAPIVVTMAGGLSVPVIGERYGWRWALLVVAPAVVGSLAFAAFWGTRTPRAERAAASAAPARLLADGGGRVLLALVVAMGLGSFGMAGASGFAVRSLVESGVPVAVAGALLAAAGLGALVVRVAGGWWLDRADGTGDRVVLTLVLLGTAGAGLMATMVPALMVVGLFLCVCAGWTWPPVLMMRGIRKFVHAPGRASGVLQIGTSVGAATGPLAVGLLVEGVSFPVAWLVVVTSGVLALVIVRVWCRSEA
ncbi:MFS transporter [Oryzobacter telluris]|uniref:MFS transporter n=1 Tax=Oryzobacter telluris TaxID=3149179 RepID=UPI00370DDDC9